MIVRVPCAAATCAAQRSARSPRCNTVCCARCLRCRFQRERVVWLVGLSCVPRQSIWRCAQMLPSLPLQWSHLPRHRSLLFRCPVILTACTRSLARSVPHFSGACVPWQRAPPVVSPFSVAGRHTHTAPLFLASHGRAALSGCLGPKSLARSRPLCRACVACTSHSLRVQVLVFSIIIAAC